MKTYSSVKQRFKPTGTGILNRKHAINSHILRKKETKQKSNLTQTGLVHESDVKNIKQQLCL